MDTSQLALVPFAVIAAGGTVFYALIVAATGRLHRRPAPLSQGKTPRISVLKPLAGIDIGLEDNLRSVFAQQYSDFEILLGVSAADDPAAAVVRKLIAERPKVDASLIVTGEPSPDRDPNRKAHNLRGLAAQAAGEILLISDSDIRLAPDALGAVAADFADPRVGVSTCPYRGVGGPSLWSQLEAVGMNTEFWGGVFVAQMLAPMDFAVGPTMAVRRACLDELGGFESVRDYLAEDFILGRNARRNGWQVTLSQHVVEHRIGSQRFLPNWKHRLRWYRSTRRSRPAGYLAQVFTYPLPFAITLTALTGGATWSWALLAACAVLRAAAARATAKFLGQRTGVRFWTLLPLQDLLSFLVWSAAFFGNRVVWRSHQFHVTRGGRLKPVQRP